MFKSPEPDKSPSTQSLDQETIITESIKITVSDQSRLSSNTAYQSRSLPINQEHNKSIKIAAYQSITRTLPINQDRCLSIENTTNQSGSLPINQEICHQSRSLSVKQYSLIPYHMEPVYEVSATSLYASSIDHSIHYRVQCINS